MTSLQQGVYTIVFVLHAVIYRSLRIPGHHVVRSTHTAGVEKGPDEKHKLSFSKLL